MAINFPLTKPAAPGFTRFDLAWPTLLGRTGGGLTAAEQVQEWDDAPLRMVAELPVFGAGPAPHDRATLGQWEGFFGALRGGAGTFLAGDPRHSSLLGAGPDGSVAAFPTADGAQSAAGKTLNTRGWGANRSGALKRGDVLQLAKNYLLNPAALDAADWVKVGVGVAAPAVTPNAAANPDPGAVVDADQIDFPATGAGQTSSIYQAGSSVPQIAGRTFQATVWLRTVSGSFNVRVDIRNQSGVTRGQATMALSTSWVRVIGLAGLMAAGDTAVTLLLEQIENQSAKSIYAWGAMLYSTELDARLYKVVGTADLSADGNGDIAVDVLPRLRAAARDFSPLILTNAVGTWRLAKSIERVMDRRMLCSLGFEAVEAINLV